MKSNKQTSVEWLVKYLNERGYIQAPSFGHSIIDKAIEQAKEMEKQQIKDAYDQGDIQLVNGNQYYEQTYGGKDE
jgi:hypothetical protein